MSVHRDELSAAFQRHGGDRAVGRRFASIPFA